MRLRIRNRLNPSKPFTLISPTAEIDVRSAGSRWHWTWIDGTPASCGPYSLWKKQARASFVAGGIEVSSGVVTYQHFGIVAIACIEWTFGNQTLQETPRGCCGGIIRLEGRIIAAWRRYPRVELVLRDSIPGPLQCICIGMVLANGFD